MPVGEDVPHSSPPPTWVISATEHPYQTIFDSHPEPMWILDADTLRFLAVNDAAVKEYGFTRDEFLGMSLFDIRPPAETPKLLDYCNQMRERPLLAESGTSDVWRHRRKSGEIMEVEVRWRPILHNDRISIVSTMREVTDTKRVREQNNLQSSALSQVSEAVFAVDNSRRVVYWNNAAEQLYGFSEEEMMGRRFDEVMRYQYVTPEDELRAKQSLKEIGSWRGEKLQRKKNGQVFFVDASITTLKNEQGAVVGLLAVHRDISQQKQVQRELVESNEALTAIIASSPIAIIVNDREGIVKCWNPAAQQIFGWSETEMIGQSFHRLVGEDEAGSYCEFRERLLAGEAFANVETRRVRKDGVPIDVSVSSAPLHDIDGSVVGTVTLITDITDRKRTQDELVLAKEAADAANRAKTEFVANISHEIRTPLSAILGFAEMMFDAKQTVGERLNCIARIRHNVKNLTALVEDLLDLSKVEAGKFEVAPTEILLLPELAEALTVLQTQVLRKGLGLKVIFQGPIPKTITSDPTRLRQILVNIIGNAIKFTERGTVTVSVQLRTEEGRSPQLTFDISDTGPGITPKQAEGIFEPFAQIDSSVTRRFGGTGLGLNLSRRLARILGGDVELLRSLPGKGSTFRVSIDPGDLKGVPMIEGVTQNDLISKQVKPLTYADGSLNGMRVLLVEDGQDNRFLISHFLRSSGAHVDAAINGLEGAEKAVRGNYDLILMDIQMPVLDGYEATRRLRAEGVSTPIVALTAHAMKGEKARCFEVGCNGYLSKPIDAKTLIEMVSRYRNDASPRAGTK